MRITILCVGKLKEDYWRAAAAEYTKRLSGYCTLKIVETADERIPDGLDPAGEERIKQKETNRLLEKISDRDFVIALDLAGIPLSSQGLSELMSEHMLRGISGFTFVIGGSLGLAQPILNRANYRLSASNMTFPHQLMRVILLEQIYRAFKIARGETYHK